MRSNQHTQKDLIKKVSVRVVLFVAVMMVMFFLPAGTFAYWEAWVFLAVILSLMCSFLIYFLIKDPEMLERRMRTREKEARQKMIVKFMFVCSLISFLLPGFDKRFGWSEVPVAGVIGADIMVMLGYSITFFAFRENRFASRIVEIQKGQEVISSGPYAIVRHPMYVGAALIFMFTPLALGSYWALIPALLNLPLIAVRIKNEETVLEKDLDGYREYMQNTRYRLIPGLW
jgi:protein-S-isoprenylcysteine O-methyltransferase Ste14